MKTNNKIQMFAVAAVALAAVACTDTWDEHYGNEGRPVSDKSLLQVMEEQGDLGDFLKVLRATHVFSNNKPTKVTYADLLASDQTFTVWAPRTGCSMWTLCWRNARLCRAILCAGSTLYRIILRIS